MNIENQVKKTIEKYKLLNKKDKVAVALSGGKDSMTALYLLKKFGYDVSGLMIDLHLGEWSEKNRKNAEKFCRELGVKLYLIDLRKELGSGICFIKQVVKEKKGLTGCTVCGVIKKWVLNKWSKKFKFDKIATGHNLDDECHTVLMNFLKGNLILGLNSTPSTGVPVKGFVQRIKPLFFVPEHYVLEYSKKMKFPVLYEKCPCAFNTYRVDTRAWMSEFNDKEKLKIVQGFQKQIPNLRKKYNFGVQIQECRVCGEPSRHEVCNACKIFECLKKI